MIAGRAARPLLAALLLACCAPRPVPADPALWLVEGPSGQKAWLFGTIHGLDRPALWKTPRVGKALEQSDMVMVEVAGLNDGPAMAQTFDRLAHTPDQPPLTRRVEPDLRKDLKRILARTGLRESRFSDVETWAAAIILARAQTPDSKPEYGIDRAVIAEAGTKPVVEFEGAEGQLRLFDTLPEKEQRDLLDAVVADSDALDPDNADLADAWRRGDMAVIAKETGRGMLADPELRAALFTDRNRRWIVKLAAEMQAGKHPFVAVGAAHMAGPQGLPALLRAEGYEVTRLR